LPHPALPQTSVGRPFGKPPKVISSSPCIPVGVLASAVRRYLPLVIAVSVGTKLLERFFIDCGQTYHCEPSKKNQWRLITAQRIAKKKAVSISQGIDRFHQLLKVHGFRKVG
jgi:hypothetical protein